MPLKGKDASYHQPFSCLLRFPISKSSWCWVRVMPRTAACDLQHAYGRCAKYYATVAFAWWLVPLSHLVSIKHRQNLLARYKELKTKWSFKCSSWDPLFSQKKSRVTWGSGSLDPFFFFPPPNFQDTSVEKHALAQLCEALSLQLGTCTMPCMQSSWQCRQWLFLSSWSPCRWLCFGGPQCNLTQHLRITQAPWCLLL